MTESWYALQCASLSLREDWLKTYVRDLVREAFTMPLHTFISTVLFAAKKAAPPPTPTLTDPSILCNNTACLLSLLRPSPVLPEPFSLQIKEKITQYAGVQYGPEWDKIEDAARHLYIDLPIVEESTTSWGRCAIS